MEVENRMKDFLTMYNTFTESCFNSCVSNLNYRHLTPEEKECAEKCTDKLVNLNHRLISVYMEINPMNRQLAEQGQPPVAQGDHPPPTQDHPASTHGNLADQVQQVFGEEARIKPEKVDGVMPAEGGHQLQTG